MRMLTAALTITALAMVGAGELSAQSTTGAASVTVPEVLVITSVTDLTMDGTGFDFSAGETSTSTGTVDITTRANVAHAVDVSSTDITDGSTVLGFEVNDANGVAQPVSGATVKALANLNAGTQANSITFRATADVNTHAPGAYTGTITYTVVANY